MKIRLVNKTIYDVTRCEIVNGNLEIDYENQTAEEVQTIMSVPVNLSTIELLTDDNAVYGVLEGWTKYGGVLLNGTVKTAILIKPADVTEERLTTAESNALEAKTATQEQASEIEQMKDQISEGSGVDQELLSATSVVARANAQALSDQDALSAKILYDTFDDLAKEGYTAEKQGFKFRDGDDLWKTAQDNVTFQAQYRPGEGTESLYTHIDESHAGTQDDPIPAKANMEYEYGKYYSEGDVIYLCKRGGIPEEDAVAMYGEKVTLQYLPSALVGQYFEAV